MTPRRMAISAFVACHLVAITFAALPSGEFVARTPATTFRTFEGVTAMADTLGVGLSDVVGALQTPLASRLVTSYTELLNLSQMWAMFSNPPQYDRYWRIRHFVRGVGGRTWTATELVGPAHSEYETRVLRSFRASYADKALEIAFNDFIKRRKPATIAPRTRPEDLPDDLAPLGRYYARQFAALHLQPGERVVRTEVWAGGVATKPPGAEWNEAALNARRAALLEYGDGPVIERLLVPPYPPYHGVEMQADIEWLLEYYEES